MLVKRQSSKKKVVGCGVERNKRNRKRPKREGSTMGCLFHQSLKFYNNKFLFFGLKTLRTSMTFDWLNHQVECSRVSTTKFNLMKEEFCVSSQEKYINLSAIVLSLQIPDIYLIVGFIEQGIQIRQQSILGFQSISKKQKIIYRIHSDPVDRNWFLSTMCSIVLYPAFYEYKNVQS